MNFKDEKEAKRFLAIWALIIVGICIIIALLAPNAYAQRPNKRQEKVMNKYHKLNNPHIKKWKPCKKTLVHLSKQSRFGCL